MVSSRIKQRLNTAASERGAGSLFMIISLSFMILLAGFSYDVGQMFAVQREATNIAATAARHGANAVDTDSLYQTGVATYDLGDAGDAIRSAVDASDATLVSHTFYGPHEEISVKVEMDHETVLLKIIGINEIQVEGVGTARVQNGAG